MGQTTGIEWADATVNFWIGCRRISVACDHCYAANWAQRFGVVDWDTGVHRRARLASAESETIRLQRTAVRQGRRLRVVSNSLSDFFDLEIDAGWRHAAMQIMGAASSIDWLVLTKRPQVARAFLSSEEARKSYNSRRPEPDVWPPRNLWLGATVENQAMADLRIEILRETPAAVRFLSVEPMLGPIDLRLAERPVGINPVGIDWVIAGGESGLHARPVQPAWLRSLRDQCFGARVPFFFKQWGAWVPFDQVGASRVETIGQDRARLYSAGAVMFDGRAFQTRDDGSGTLLVKVGKGRAGRGLDGWIWKQQPIALQRAAE